MAEQNDIAPSEVQQTPSESPLPIGGEQPTPSAAKALYDQLNKGQLYTKSFDEFQKQFSNPQTIDKLYQNLNDAKLYTKNKDQFYDQFFPSAKTPAAPAVPEHQISHTPVQDIRHLNDLASQPIRSTTTTLDPMSGGSMIDYNQEDIARNKGFQDRYEKSITDLAGNWGTDPKATKQAIQDFPDEPNEDKLKSFAGLAKDNPVYYSRIKSANDIRMAIAQGPDGINDANVFNHLQTADNYEDLQHNIALQQEIMHKHGLGQQYFEKLKEAQAPLVNTLDPGLHIQYWNSDDQKLGLSEFQYAGLETEKMFNPGKYQQDVAIIRHNRGLDEGSQAVPIPQGKEGYAYDRGVENVLYALENQGRQNTGKFIDQRSAELGPQIDGLKKKYQDFINSTDDPLLQKHFFQEFQTDPMLQEAAKLDEGQQSIDYARTEDQRRFPLNYGDHATRLVKDAVSTTNGWAGVAGKQVLIGTGESSDNTLRFIKNTFINLLGSEQMQAENAASNIGHQALTQLAGYEGSAFSMQESPLLISDRLAEHIQRIFNDPSRSTEQKNQEATDLVLNHQGEIKVNAKVGQQNLTGKAVIYSAANTIGQILGIADQSLLMGGLLGDASKAQQMANAFTPMYASTQNQLYEQALARGDEKPLLSSHLDAAIISLASLINPDIKVVKGALVGPETGIGKLIAGVDESNWNKVLSTNKSLVDRMVAGTKATARQLGLANLQYGLIVPSAQYLVHKNILNEDPNLGDAIKDGLLQTNISMALPALLHGVWGGVNATKVNPTQKYAIVEAGLHPKENVELIDQLVEKGQVTPDRADQIKEVIKQTGQILEHTEAVKSDGTWMNEQEVSDLTYQMLRKKVLEGKLKNAPDPQKPAIEAKIHEVNQSISDLHTSDEHKQKSELNQLLTDNLDRIRDKIQPMESQVREGIKRNEPEQVFKEIYDQASQTTNVDGKDVSSRGATEETFGKALVEKAFELHKQKPEKSAVPPTEEQVIPVKPQEGAAPEPPGTEKPAAPSFLQSRHADTIHDEQGIVSGPNNKELSPKGKRDANDLAKDVEGKGVTKIITSGLERSKETGEKVAEKTGATVESRPALDTWNIKDFDGLKDDEFKDVQQWFVENPDSTVYEGPLEKYRGKEVAESINEYADRIIPEMEKIEKENGPETLLINHSNNMMLWDAYLKNAREWNEQARQDYLHAEKPEPATLTNQTENNAIQERSPAGEVPRAGTTGENIPAGSEGVGPGQQGEATAGEANGTGEGQEPPSGPGGQEVTAGNSRGREVGPSHDNMTELALRLGLTEPERGTVLTPAEYAARGRIMIAGGADPEKVARRFERTGNISPDIISVARAHLENLEALADKTGDQHGRDSNEYKTALDKLQNWITNVMKPMGTRAGATFTSLQGRKDMDTGSFTSVARNFYELHGRELTEKQAVRIKDLTKTVKELREENTKLVDKLSKAHDAGDASQKNKKATPQLKKQAKDLAKKIRDTGKLNRPGMFSVATPASLIWDAGVEIVAKAVEIGGDLGDAILKGVEHVKDSEWYKGLSGADKKKAIDEFTDWHQENADKATTQRIKALEKRLSDLREGKEKSKPADRVKTDREKELEQQIADIRKEKAPEARAATRVKALQKELADLQEGIIKSREKPREKTTEEKELEDHIFDLKEKMGLVKPKATPQPARATMPQQTLAEKMVGKQTKNFSQEDAKGVWQHVKDNYLATGKTLGEALRGTATDLGLSAEQVLAAIATPKDGHKITTELWKKQHEYNKARQYAMRFVDTADQSAAKKFFNNLPSNFFNLKTYGHGTVGNITHAATNIFRPSVWSAYWPNVIKSFSLAYGTTANYEKAISLLESSPNFDEWKRAGLTIDPREAYDDYQVFGKKQSWLGEAGTRGFTGLKMMRYDLAELWYNRASATERSDPNFREEIAKLANHATGHSEVKVGKVVKALTFAPGLEVSRWQRMITDPYKAADTFIHWKSATPAERAAAKIVAAGAGERLGIYTAALAANAGLLAALGSKQKVNWDDPSHSDWLKFKLNDKTLDITGGVLGPLRLLHTLGSEAYKAYFGEKKDLRVKPNDKDATTLWQQMRYKMAPLPGDIMELGTGQDAIGNTVPWSKVTPGKDRKQLTGWDYTRDVALPIPIAAGFNAYYDTMEKQNVPSQKTKAIWDGVITGTIEGFAGAKYEPDYSLDDKPTGRTGRTGGHAR